MPGIIRTQNIITVGGGSLAPPDSLYFASNEVPFVDSLLTDDFRRGYQYIHTIDENTALGTPWWIGGQTGLEWGGNDQGFKPPNPAGAVRNLAAIGKKPRFTKSDYVATTGVIPHGTTQGNNGMHNLLGRISAGYNEIYVRAYKYHVEAGFYGAGNPSTSYLWGGQKSYTLNRTDDDLGIYWAGVGYNVGTDHQSTAGELMATNNHGTNVILGQNQSNTIFEVPGHWYCEEFHIRLNTSGATDGIFQLWINDGGPTGDFSGQTPILRAQHTNVDWGYNAATEPKRLGVVWLENWSNTVIVPSIQSEGEQFWANVHVRTSAPVGFAA